MLFTTRITDALPVEPSVTPADFRDIPFTPTLLLPLPLTSTIRTHFDFSACEHGFNMYFEEMIQGDKQDKLFHRDHFHTWEEVKATVIREAFPDPRDNVWATLMKAELTTLAFRVGYTLGWLSALGLTNRPLALQGVDLLSQLVSIQHTHSTPSYPHTHTRTVGGDGFPLDM